jgi:ribosomal protein L34E
MHRSLKFAKKKKVKTPGGRISFHRITKKKTASCGICGKLLLGTRRARANPGMCPACSRETTKLKVKTYVQ